MFQTTNQNKMMDKMMDKNTTVWLLRCGNALDLIIPKPPTKIWVIPVLTVQGVFARFSPMSEYHKKLKSLIILKGHPNLQPNPTLNSTSYLEVGIAHVNVFTSRSPDPQ